MTGRVPFARAAFGVVIAAWALGSVAPAHATTRMYTGSLVVHAFGNDTTTGGSSPFSTSSHFGIPLAGRCHTGPYHAKETLTFPTMEKSPPTQTVMFTIPTYGGAQPIDTNGDTVPDVPAGCASASRTGGDPLTGVGPVNTTGVSSTSRTSQDPRRFTLPNFALRRTNSGASLFVYGVYAWEVHFAALHNDAGVFAKNGGDGSFAVTNAHPNAPSKAIQSAGKNEFGGVMRLLGSYSESQGYVYAGVQTTVFYFDWLLDYLGHGGQATQNGVVTAGYIKSRQNHHYRRSSGYQGTSTVYAEAFKWTTGTVSVTALGGSFPTVLRRAGYDSRTAMGSGTVQLVSPMLTRWVTPDCCQSSTAGIGILNVRFVPEPGSWTLLGAGVSMLALLAHLRRRAKR